MSARLEALPQYPGAGQIVALNLVKAIAHVLGHLGLHGSHGLFIVGPAAGTASMGMGDMDGGDEETVYLLYPGQEEGSSMGPARR